MKPTPTPNAGADPVRPLPGPPASETELVAELLSGDATAFSTIVGNYSSGLLRVARLFVSSRGVAEEVVQDTWLAVLTALPSFEGRSSLRTWVFRIVANLAKTRAHKEGRTIPFSAFDSDDDEPAVDPSRFASNGHWATGRGKWQGGDTERLVMRREAVECLERELERLPAQQRAVVLLRDVEGFEAEEARNILGLSESNERVLLHRGRSKLRAALEEHLERG